MEAAESADLVTETMIPEGPVEMIIAGGAITWFVFLFAFFLFVTFIVGCIIRKKRFSLCYLGLSFIPFFLGMTATFSGLMGAFSAISLNPQATAADFAAGVYVALFPNLVGSVFSAMSVIAACILIAFSREEKNA